MTSSKGVELIAQERFRQKEEEGFDARHDAMHVNDELAVYAACYAIDGLEYEIPGGTSYIEIDRLFTGKREGECIDPLPSDFRIKEGTRIEKLVKAGALIAAEIDRLKALEG